MDLGFIYQKIVVGTHHDFFYGIRSPHKILGYLALAHFLTRYILFVWTGSMHFSKTPYDLWWVLAHFTLSVSSFLFPIQKTRNFANQIIWRELQLHNIAFTARSCAIITIEVCYPTSSIFLRFCIVMAFHWLADIVTYFCGEGATMRDMSYDGMFVPLWTKPWFDQFYAISQFGATITLILPTALTIEHAFMVMFAIQLSTFLMTLRRKGIINNDMWHLAYTASLLANYRVGSEHPNSHIGILQIIFYLWRVVLRQPKYIGWSLLFLIYGVYLHRVKVTQ